MFFSANECPIVDGQRTFNLFNYAVGKKWKAIPYPKESNWVGALVKSCVSIKHQRSGYCCCCCCFPVDCGECLSTSLALCLSYDSSPSSCSFRQYSGSFRGQQNTTHFTASSSNSWLIFQLRACFVPTGQYTRTREINFCENQLIFHLHERLEDCEGVYALWIAIAPSSAGWVDGVAVTSLLEWVNDDMISK